MKFKIIGTILVIVVVLVSIVIGTAMKNSSTPDGEPQTEQPAQ